MKIDNKIVYIETNKLKLDPKNPRLNEKTPKSQTELLDEMGDWAIDEIASSILMSGFWPHEALIVVNEKLTSKATSTSPIVVEGNRRLAAVLNLLQAIDGKPTSPKWADLAARATPSAIAGLKTLPTIKAESRGDVDAFLGFRHVTGIKQWEPLEKAAFIAKLINQGNSYEDTMRMIGSKTSTVRQNYIAFNLYNQLCEIEEVASERIREKFSVLFLALRSPGTQQFLGIDINATPKNAKRPLDAKHRSYAIQFAKWGFGDQEHEPVITDSRYIDEFGMILANKEAVSYLERTVDPKFEIAFRKAGGDRAEAAKSLSRATDAVEDVLSTIHLHADDPEIRAAADRLFKGIEELKQRIGIGAKQ